MAEPDEMKTHFVIYPMLALGGHRGALGCLNGLILFKALDQGHLLFQKQTVSGLLIAPQTPACVHYWLQLVQPSVPNVCLMKKTRIICFAVVPTDIPFLQQKYETLIFTLYHFLTDG